jgi:ammonia channel protein AmtB
MVSRENAVILLFMAAGLALAYGGRVATNLSDTVLFGVLIFVAVVAPQLVNGYLDDADSP